MRAEYKRDVNHSYLVMDSEAEQDIASYRIRMLLGNSISTFLSCTVKGLNGNTLFYYDISGEQSISALYERQKMGLQELQTIFKGIVEGFGQTEEYLLEPDDLVLLPEYMYLNGEKGQLQLCYLPGYQKDIRQQFCSFSEYVLPKIDHKDSQAVSLGYAIYRLALEEGVQADKMKEELYQVREHMPNPTERVTAEADKMWKEHQKREEEILRREAMNAFFGEDEPEEKMAFDGARWAAVGIGILGSVGIGAGVWLGILPWGVAVLFWIVALVVWGVGMLVWKNFSKKQKEIGNPVTQQEVLWEEEAKEWKDMGDEKNRQTVHTDTKPEETTVLYQAEQPAVSSLVSKIPGQFPTIFLEKEMIVVGKLPKAADVILETSTISRVHARICEREGEYYLSDLNSRNGTCVNGKILQGEEEYLLKNHDEVSFADVQYIFMK
ncbi:MAG: DUF6382 domain-containing protein [Blautia sp.]|jgi:hypothetical protein